MGRDAVSTPRLFTLDEAERTLPLVRRIVHDLMLEHPAWRRAVARYELLAGSAHAESGESEELRLTREEVERRAERIGAFLAELEAIGAHFKGFESGLVDFYSMRDDHLIFLCWQYGEPRIAHWHEIDQGFSGRRPVDQSLLTEVESA